MSVIDEYLYMRLDGPLPSSPTGKVKRMDAKLKTYMDSVLAGLKVNRIDLIPNTITDTEYVKKGGVNDWPSWSIHTHEFPTDLITEEQTPVILDASWDDAG